jgi:hypothetical protein
MASGGWRLVAAEIENEGRGGSRWSGVMILWVVVSDEFVQ